MATHNYASHTDSLGRSVGARLQAFGYSYVPYAENIAGGWGDAQTALIQWQNACDPDATGACTYAHRRNMLNPSFVAIGIGLAYNAGSTYGWHWATDFGGVLDNSTTPPSNASAPVITSISAGQTTTLAWSVAGATALTIDNGVGSVTGLSSKSASPASTVTYRLTASNGAGSSSAAVTVTVNTAPVVDTQPPTPPAIISATAASTTEVDLVWQASADNVGVAGYQIVRNGAPAASVAANALRQSHTSVQPGTSYTYTVRSFDSAGNYSSPSNSVQVTTPQAPGTACPPPASGAFTGCYYNTTDLSGPPALVRTDASINFNWRYSPPGQTVSGAAFSARWQGIFHFDAGTYSFVVMASDGVRLYVDGKLIVDRWRDQVPYTYTVKQSLTSGDHAVTLEYYESTGTPTVYLSWQSVSTTAVPVVSSFTATPAAINSGGSTTLTLAVSGATSVSIDNGVGDVAGATSKVVVPTRTTTYRLTATNRQGPANAAVTVTVKTSLGTDTQPPTNSAIVSAAASSSTQVNLAWTAATDNVGVTGYQVPRNGAPLISLPAASLSYVDTTVGCGRDLQLRRQGVRCRAGFLFAGQCGLGDCAFVYNAERVLSRHQCLHGLLLQQRRASGCTGAYQDRHSDQLRLEVRTSGSEAREHVFSTLARKLHF